MITLPVAGCDAETVDLVVELRTDFVAGVEFTNVRTELASRGSELTPARVGEDFTERQRVAEFAGLAPGTHMLSVALVDAAGRDVIVRRVRVMQTSSFSVTVLISRDCAAVDCPGPMDGPDAVECVGGRCAPLQCVDGDEPSCPDAECARASDCPPMAACARTQCVTGSCLYASDPSMCGAGEYCDAERGCLPIPNPADAGPDDAGIDAGVDAGVDAGTCAETPCRLLVPQCGCLAGQMCQRTVPGDVFRECVSEGATAAGEVCTDSLDCQAGHSCVFQGTGDGVCAAFCGSAADCPPSTECLELALMTEPIGSCSATCNPLDGSGCAGTLSCLFYRGARPPGSDGHLGGHVRAGANARGRGGLRRPRRVRPRPRLRRGHVPRGVRRGRRALRHGHVLGRRGRTGAHRRRHLRWLSLAQRAPA